MIVNLRSHYTLVLSHQELVQIGFCSGDLRHMCSQTTYSTIKLRVTWDLENIPSCLKSEGGNNCDTLILWEFYRKLVLWCYHKTGIQCYRVIHRRNSVHFLFDHNQDNVNPLDDLAHYDFTGFDTYLHTCKDGSTKWSWKVHLNIRNHDVISSMRPAIVRYHI